MHRHYHEDKMLKAMLTITLVHKLSMNTLQILLLLIHLFFDASDNYDLINIKYDDLINEHRILSKWYEF